ncbi:MAG: MSMEG_6728 family protein [Candidatus Hodarchaeota archaeon]
MQTFITSHDMVENAKNLDYKRLGKQRIEVIQILRVLLKLGPQGWKNHPIVKLWKGYESYLLNVYLKAILDEWKRRGYKNVKCEDHYMQISKVLEGKKVEKPPWITDEFITSHRSNLIRKDEKFYKPRFPGTPLNLPYIWSHKEG